MKNILFVNACVRPESRTKALAEYLISKLDGNATEVNLEAEDIAPLTMETLARRMELTEKGEFDDPIFKYAKQFAEADAIVIAAPYWDLSFPASVKAYFELVDAVPITFKYLEDGTPAGCCKAKDLYYVTTAGGPLFADLGFEYVKALSDSFYKIGNICRVSADMLDVWGVNVEEKLAAARAEIDNIFKGE